MSAVPQRQESYGELLNKLYKAHRRTKDLKREAANAKRRGKRCMQTPEYTADDVNKHIIETQQQNKEYYRIVTNS